MEFHYYSGATVRVGDRVRTGSGHFGVVEEIIAPGSEAAKQYDCPDGGVLVIQDWRGTKSPLMMTPPDGIYWEDLELIERGS